jgi:hypothetical protein
MKFLLCALTRFMQSDPTTKLSLTDQLRGFARLCDGIAKAEPQRKNVIARADSAFRSGVEVDVTIHGIARPRSLTTCGANADKQTKLNSILETTIAIIASHPNNAYEIPKRLSK